MIAGGNGGVVSKVPLNVTLSPSVTLRINSAKGLGVVGLIRTAPRLTPSFFVAEFTLSKANVLIRITFDIKPVGGEENCESLQPKLSKTSF